MPKKADTRIADAGQCQRQAHQTWLRRICYALVNTTTQIARKMLMPTDRHQPKLNELDAVVIVLLVSCLQKHHNKRLGLG